MMGGRGQVSSFADTSYWLEHRPGNPIEYLDEVATVDNIAESGLFPSNFLEHPENYLLMNDAGAQETIEILREAQGNPDMEVTVYRGAPSGELNTGDWVSLSRTYAEKYAGTAGWSDNPNSKVYSFTTKASNLSFDGDDISEFGYWGANKKSKKK